MSDDRELPGFDRDLRMCLIRPGDCESNLADGEAALTFETPEALTPDASPECRVAIGREERLVNS